MEGIRVEIFLYGTRELSVRKAHMRRKLTAWVTIFGSKVCNYCGSLQPIMGMIYIANLTSSYLLATQVLWSTDFELRISSEVIVFTRVFIFTLVVIHA
jgi:hypothetical protein